MPGLADIINVSISTSTQKATRASVGIPLILGTTTPLTSFPELVRTYTALADVATDFGATSPEYLCATAIFAQDPHPPSIKIARRTHKPTMRWAVTPTAANTTKYKLKFNNSAIDVTSDADATVTEIIALLKTALDALALPITTSDQGAYLRIVENAAGVWHSLRLDDSAVKGGLLSVVQDNADGGIATDLAAVALEDNNWYTLHSTFGSAAEIAAAATWVETAGKYFFADSQDSDIIGAGGGDIATTLKTAARLRSTVCYHEDNRLFFGGGWAGRVLPIPPGTEDWMFKTISGLTPSPLSATQESNAAGDQSTAGKNAAVYVQVAGVNMAKKGKAAGGEWIDVIRGRDDLVLELQADVLNLLTGSDKLPYDDRGIGAVEALIRKNLRKRQPNFIALSPEPTVTVPRVVDVSSSDKSNRVLNGVSFQATLTGAIHAAQITGRLIP